MFTQEQHLEDLVRHIELVREACLLLGKRLMSRGEVPFGRLLIAQGFVHDATKFYGIEWDYLHSGPDTPKQDLERAIKQHTSTNSHHPEYHGGIENMPRIDIAEMVCDWYARSTEFGTGLRDWITESAVNKYKIDLEGKQYKWMNDFVSVLLTNSFTKE